MKITFATGNVHKLQEINEIVARQVIMPNNVVCGSVNNGVEFVLPPVDFDPVEDGETFEENSLIKAREAARLSGMMSLADDSGLCVEALGGAPGIHSARYAETAQARIDKLLDVLGDLDNRKAKFVCVMTLVDAEGNILFQSRGECHGEIAKKQSGVNGFGYDPIFLVEGTRLTMAEMSEEEKNEISHRGMALKKVLEFLTEMNPTTHRYFTA